MGFRTSLVFLLACTSVVVPTARSGNAALKMESPDGRLRIDLSLGKGDGTSGVPLYRLAFQGRELLGPSSLGLRLRDADLSSGFRIRGVRHKTKHDTFRLPLGKTSRVNEPYREYVVDLEQVNAPHRRLTLTFRLYHDGAAFRYTVPLQPGLRDFHLAHEESQFTLAGSPRIYALPLDYGSAYETHYKIGPFADFPAGKTLGLPAAFRYPDAYLLITEADLHDYAVMYLSPSAVHPGTFTVELPPSSGMDPSPVQGTLPFHSPWRVMMAADSPKPVLESQMLLSLNPPSRIPDTSWIHPGKILFQWWNGYIVPGSHFDPPSGVLRESTLKGYVDFCAKYGIPYLSFDGYEFDKAWYGGKVLPFDPKTQDVTRWAPEVNLPAVISYAKEKGIRIRLWLHEAGLTEQNMERVFSTYAGWGASGVMVDFMGNDTQKGVARIDEILRVGAKYHLIVSLHGIAKPTGLQRTYPNLLTEEAVMGQEYNKWPGPHSDPAHEVNVGIIRGAVGPMDTHQGSFRPVPPDRFTPHSLAPNSMGTLAHQIATYVTYENEQPMLDDYPQAYEKHPAAFGFVRQVPVTWDETRVLMADLDQQFLTVARRSGRDWYIGSISGTHSGKYPIPLAFLGPGRYTAEVYSDTKESAMDGESIAKSVFPVSATDRLAVDLAPAGGQAVWIHAASTKP